MSEESLLDVEKKLKNDADGTYRQSLIAQLEKHRDEFESSRKGLLSPEEYDIAESMQKAVEAAIDFIQTYNPE